MDDRKIINLKYNQTQDCFTCCMETGIRVYNIEPLVEKVRYDSSMVGSVAICEMLYRTNLLAIVAGGTRPKFPDTTLLIYDDLSKKFVMELTFPLSITGVRLRRDKLAVTLIHGIYLFSFPSHVKKLMSLDTARNPRGLCELTSLNACDRSLVIFPGQKVGSVQIVDLTYNEVGSSSAPVCIQVHKTELVCLAINQQSTKIATASAMGTLIRVWDISTRRQLIELRRGSDPANIYSINFSRSSDFLCCSSDKGTIHIFALHNTRLNKRMIIHKAGILAEYVNSQWAMTNFTVPPECACFCAFSGKNSVVAICVDGTFHKYLFSEDGNCNREAFDVFLDVCDDEEILL